MKGQFFLVAAMMATCYFVLTTSGVEAQQRQVRTLPQYQARNPQQQQRIAQLKKEAERAQKQHQMQLDKVRKLERFERPMEYIKKGADLGVGVVGGKVGPVGKGIGYLYQGVTKSILDPQGAERRKRLSDESKARREQERMKKQKWEEDFRKRQEEFNTRWGLPQIGPVQGPAPSSEAPNRMFFQER
jgi:TolA-binding protein